MSLLLTYYLLHKELLNTLIPYLYSTLTRNTQRALIRQRIPTGFLYLSKHPPTTTVSQQSVYIGGGLPTFFILSAVYNVVYKGK